MRGLMYTTQCTKSHIYLYFLEYVQEIFGIEQDKEGLNLLRIIDTKKVTAIVAANVRKPVNHIYLGKLQKICIHALTEKRRKAPGFSHGDEQAVSRLRVSVGAAQFPLHFDGFAYQKLLSVRIIARGGTMNSKENDAKKRYTGSVKTYKFKLYKSTHNDRLHWMINAAGLSYNHCLSLYKRYYRVSQNAE